MSEASATLARTLAMLVLRASSRKRRRALLEDRTLQILLADLVAVRRTAAGMTAGAEVATDVDHEKRCGRALESGRYARPTSSIEKYALAVGARVEIRVRRPWGGFGASSCGRAAAPNTISMASTAGSASWTSPD